MFELIKKYYRMGIYGAAELALFVQNGTLTEEQAQEAAAQKQQER